MENFIAHNPTSVHFGKDVLNNLGETAAGLGKKVLLMYGKGSVLKNGSYLKTTDQLAASSLEVCEFRGIMPNPVHSMADRAASVGIENNVDMVIALGGGSVIDTAKIAAICIAEKCKAWDVMKSRWVPKKTTPLIAILTLPATGTEMNPTAVMQNMETREKFGYVNPLNYPVHSFLDPSYTLSLPLDYTAFGIIDLIAHVLENYFGKGDASLSDRFGEAIIKEALVYGPLLIEKPSDYDLRSRIMWAATNALNNLTYYGKQSGDWGSHAFGHMLSVLYDTPHGASLSIAFPAYLRHLKPHLTGQLGKLGSALFNTKDPDETIDFLEGFFVALNCPVRLRDIGIGKKHKAEILQLLIKNRSQGRTYPLSDADREAILDRML